MEKRQQRFLITNIKTQKKMPVQSKIELPQVKLTNNYEMFSFLEGNRSVNPLHLKRLKKSMQSRVLLSPILVNENFEIIDGQHRFSVLKELKMPIQYLVADGYGLKEVQSLNSNTKNWQPDDYADGYIELGLTDYVLFKKFRNEFGLSHTISLIILSGKTFVSPNINTDFNNGDFQITDYKSALEKAVKLKSLADFYPFWHTRSFVLAMLQCFKNPAYSHTVFLSKMQYLSSKLKNYHNREQALADIEEIYNYRNGKKINLRIFETTEPPLP